MKFFHVTGYSVITGDKSTHSKGTVNNISKYDFYKIFLDMSSEMAKNNIDEDNYERVIFSGVYPIIVDAHRDNIKKLYKLWKDNYPCNILYTGPDVFFLKKTKFSDKFTKFMMFNYCHPYLKSKPEYNFEHFFDSDIRYCPSTMDESLWHEALEMEKSWPSYDTIHGSWEFEGIIWNKMLWSQGEPVSYFYRPEYAFGYSLRDFQMMIDFNTIPIENALVVHTHGSGLEHLIPKLSHLADLGVLPKELWEKYFAILNDKQ